MPRCLHVVADLGVADQLDENPRSATDLAADIGVDPDALGRVLRLRAEGIEAELTGFAALLANKTPAEIAMLKIEVFLGVFIGAVTLSG